MKKLIMTAIMMVTMVGFCQPRPHHNSPPPPPPRHQTPPPPPHNHDRGWGRGGRNFWPGFLTGLAVGTITTPATTTVVQPVQTTVVQQPVVVVKTEEKRQVWIPEHYEDVVQPDGRIVRILVPGRFVMQ